MTGKTRNRRLRREAQQEAERTGLPYATARTQVAHLPQLNVELPEDEWLALGSRLFASSDPRTYRFACAQCGNPAAGTDFAALGWDPGLAPTQCIGRYLPGQHDVTTFPCNWLAGGFIPLGGYIVLRPATESREAASVRVFPYADPAIGVEQARAAHLPVLQERARQQEEAEAEERAQEALLEADDPDPDALRCLGCFHVVGRRHRRDCLYRTEEILGASLDVTDAHAWSEPQDQLERLTALDELVPAYAAAVAKELVALGLVLPDQDISASPGDVDDSASITLWIDYARQKGRIRFSWCTDFGWRMVRCPEPDAKHTITYRNGDRIPAAASVAAELVAAENGTTTWAPAWAPHPSDYGPWQDIASALRTAVGNDQGPHRPDEVRSDID